MDAEETRRPAQVVLLAAGLGTRLGRPYPKPLTPLTGGESIMRRAVRSLREQEPGCRICAVVGFKLDLVVEAVPDVTFVYNERYDATNTCKSLLKALELSFPGGVLWFNGDVVFDPSLLPALWERMAAERSFVCVNTASVAEEEVKYTLDEQGLVRELSKTVTGGLGEAVGINYVAAGDKPVLMRRLSECADSDYFERGLELAVQHDGMRLEAFDVSGFPVVEVDFEQDLERANTFLP